MKLSVAIATYQEEENIGVCLQAIKSIADEIIVVDGGSTDKTVEIAESYGAKVIKTDNPPIFHINKQKSFDAAQGEWILYLDADEIVSRELAQEIKKVMDMNEQELAVYQEELPRKELFLKHQKLIEQRDGSVGTHSGPYVAFFMPRLNYFLGSYLKYGGVYPDGVIRLFKNKKAYLPCKDVHEQLVVDGRVGWLGHDLYHKDSPTFSRYIKRNNRYVQLLADELKQEKVVINPLTLCNYLFLKPVVWFLMTQIRHKGILDGWPGIVFSFFSALRFPKAYLKYMKGKI